MKRKIIQINEEKCNGCGTCAEACHEGAIVMEGGKAKLIRDDYCDGLGDCLPSCPTGAITFVVREAAAYDEAAVQAKKNASEKAGSCSGGGCPGTRPQAIPTRESGCTEDAERPSCLRQWPVQIKLAPVNAPYFAGADLLIAADCTAYAYASFHEKFMRGRITLVGCPKLDGVEYSDKLGEIFRNNEIRSITLVRMEVPCCGGLERAVKAAVEAAGKAIPVEIHTISIRGELVEKQPEPQISGSLMHKLRALAKRV